eukprot:5171735-Amphidinium_carterae.1
MLECLPDLTAIGFNNNAVRTFRFEAKHVSLNGASALEQASVHRIQRYQEHLSQVVVGKQTHTFLKPKNDHTRVDRWKLGHGRRRLNMVHRHVNQGADWTLPGSFAPSV